MEKSWLFSTEVISDALTKTGYDVSRLNAPFTVRPATLGACFYVLTWTTVNKIIYIISRAGND